MKSLSLPNAEYFPTLCQLMQEGHTVDIYAKGVSMRPFIESCRDVLTLAHADNYAVGDIALAEIEHRRYVIHRIVKISGEQVTLQGDGNVRATERCALQDLHARVIKITTPRRTIHTDSYGFRRRSQLWMRLLPLRRYLLAAYRLIWLHELPKRFRRNHQNSITT